MEPIAELGVSYELAQGELVRVDVDTEHYYFGPSWVSPEGKRELTYYLSLTHILDIGAPFPEGLRNYLRMASFDEQKDRLEMTGTRGTKLHDALDRLMRGEELKLREDYPTQYERDALTCFKRFMRFLAPTKFLTELRVMDTELKVAGTMDLVGQYEEWKLAVLLDPNKYLTIDSDNDLMLKEQFLDLPSKKKVTGVIDYKFTGRNTHNQAIQVAAYTTMYNRSYSKGQRASRKFTWRYSPRHKYGFDFQESTLTWQSFKRVYDTTIEYLGGYPEAPRLKVYPEKIRLFDKVEEKKS